MLLRWPRPFYSPADPSGGGSGDPAPGGDPAGGDPNAAPAGLESFWDAEKGALKVEDLAKTFGDTLKERDDLKTFKSEHEARLAELPQKPEDVKLSLPEDFKVPEGVEIKFDEADPRVVALRQMAVESKIPQAVVSKLLALEAQRTIDAETKQLEAYEAEAKAEKAKLGENADQRIAAIEGALKANLQGEQYEALRPVVTSAAAVEALETLISKIGGGSIPGAGAGSAAAKPDLASRLFPSMKN